MDIENLPIPRKEWLVPPPGLEMPNFFLDLTSEEEAKPDFLLYFGGVGCFPRGDIQCITGAPKEGKTTFARVLLSAMLSGSYCKFTTKDNNPLRVLIIDTEQGKRNTRKGAMELCKMASIDSAEAQERGLLHIMNLRAMGWEERKKEAFKWIKRINPDFVLLDGAVDLTKNANDQDSVSDLRDLLLTLSAETDSAITTIIHLNKNAGPGGDKEMRGHLGGELGNKCTEVYEVSRNNKSENFSVVKQRLARNEELPEFRLCRELKNDSIEYQIITGNELIDDTKKRVTALMCKALETIHERGLEPNSAELHKMVQSLLGANEKAAKEKVRQAKNLHIISPVPMGRKKIFKLAETDDFAGIDFTTDEDDL